MAVARFRRFPTNLWDSLKRRMLLRVRSGQMGWKRYSTKKNTYPHPSVPREAIYRRGVKKKSYRFGYKQFKMSRGSYVPDLFLSGRLWNALSGLWMVRGDKISLKFFIRRIPYYGTRAQYTTDEIAEYQARSGRDIMEVIDEEVVGSAISDMLQRENMVIDLRRNRIRYG